MIHAELERDGVPYLIVLTGTQFLYRIKPKRPPTVANGRTASCNMGYIRLDRILAVSKRVRRPRDHQDSFTINFVDHTETGDLRVKKIKFKGDVESCSKIREKLKEVVNDRHPLRKYLVLINPVSGNKNGAAIYRDKVEPLFNLCGILTEAIVTERPKHAIDILKTFDFTHIDGVVVVGGDGFLGECTTGLLLRRQIEARIDYNNPDLKIAPVDLPVGIIPAGSGDYIAQYLHGSRDPATAAIHIVLGHQQTSNVASVHKGGRLCAFSNLLLGFGLIGEMMKAIEDNRWMGKSRFTVLPLKSMMNRRVLDIEMDFLTDKWETLHQSVYGIDVNVITLKPGDKKLMPCFGDSSLSVYTTAKCKLADHIKQLAMVRDHDIDARKFDFVRHLQVQGLRVRFPKSEQNHTKRGETTQNSNHYLNCDGEVITIDTPDFEVRLHTNAVALFGDMAVKAARFQQIPTNKRIFETRL